jgi:hypothetical protein
MLASRASIGEEVMNQNIEHGIQDDGIVMILSARTTRQGSKAGQLARETCVAVRHTAGQSLIGTDADIGECAAGDRGRVGGCVSAPRAQVSMPPIWPRDQILGSSDWRRSLASKLVPPVVKPPAAGPRRRPAPFPARLLGNWSVSQPDW